MPAVWPATFASSHLTASEFHTGRAAGPEGTLEPAAARVRVSSLPLGGLPQAFFQGGARQVAAVEARSGAAPRRSGPRLSGGEAGAFGTARWEEPPRS